MTFSCWRFQFDTGADAERFLESAGFSIGRLQRDAPRGLMFGAWDIQKWRNLNDTRRAALHGTAAVTTTGAWATSPVSVFIRSSAPPEAHEALYLANDALNHARLASCQSSEAKEQAP